MQNVWSTLSLDIQIVILECAKYLLLSPSSLCDKMGWNLHVRPTSWRGIKIDVETGRIVSLNLGKSVTKSELKDLVLPPGLENLYLQDNNIDNEDIQHLKFPDSLKGLFLWNNKIGDEGLKTLLRKLPLGLRELYLNNNEITEEGLEGTLFPISLETLNLKYNPIPRNSAGCLLLPPYLKYLMLWDGTVTRDCVEQIVFPSTILEIGLYDEQERDAIRRIINRSRARRGRKRYRSVNKFYVLQ